MFHTPLGMLLFSSLMGTYTNVYVIPNDLIIKKGIDKIYDYLICADSRIISSVSHRRSRKYVVYQCIYQVLYKTTENSLMWNVILYKPKLPNISLNMMKRNDSNIFGYSDSSITDTFKICTI